MSDTSVTTPTDPKAPAAPPPVSGDPPPKPAAGDAPASSEAASQVPAVSEGAGAKPGEKAARPGDAAKADEKKTEPAKLEWKPPGFKTPQGAAIENFQVLATDADNHKVGASYGRFYGFDKLMAKGNCRADVAAFRGVLLGRPPMPAEVTDEMIAAHFGVAGFDLATHDAEVAKLAPAGLRGLVLVAVCYKKDGKDWTHCSFQDLNDKDKLKLKTEQPDLYAQLYPGEQAAG